MLKRLEIPLTDIRQNMQMPDEVGGALVLYKEHDDRYTFVGLHNPDIPDEEYCDGIVAMPLRSVYQNMEFLQQGTEVWNVMGSSRDILRNANNITNPVWRGVWRDVWEQCTGYTNGKCCVSGGKVTTCSNTIYGGHMQRKDPKGCKAQTGDTVYIIPICQSHNNSWVTDKLIVKGVYESSPGSKVFGVPAVVLTYEQPK